VLRAIETESSKLFEVRSAELLTGALLVLYTLARRRKEGSRRLIVISSLRLENSERFFVDGRPQEMLEK
jgi:hypothetical protein